MQVIECLKIVELLTKGWEKDAHYHLFYSIYISTKYCIESECTVMCEWVYCIVCECIVMCVSVL